MMFGNLTLEYYSAFNDEAKSSWDKRQTMKTGLHSSFLWSCFNVLSFTHFQLEKKRKKKSTRNSEWRHELKTGGCHVLLKIIIQRGSNWNMFSYYCHMYRCVQEQKNWIQSICQWLVQSVLHSLQGWSWHGVREEAVYRYIQSLQVKNRNLEIQTYKKYVRIVKKCTWIESLQYRRAVLYWCNRFSCDWQLN